MMCPLIRLLLKSANGFQHMRNHFSSRCLADVGSVPGKLAAFANLCDALACRPRRLRGSPCAPCQVQPRRKAFSISPDACRVSRSLSLAVAGLADTACSSCQHPTVPEIIHKSHITVSLRAKQKPSWLNKTASPVVRGSACRHFASRPC